MNYKRPLTFFILLLNLGFLFCVSAYSQTSQKLTPDGTTIKITGTNVAEGHKVFDKKFDTYYAANGNYTWVGLDLGEPHVITQIAYSPRINYGKRLETGVFEGANKPDFSDAILLYMIPAEIANNRLTSTNISNSRGFRYVRYITPRDGECNISELEFHGYKGAGNDSKLSQITNIPDIIIKTENNQSITSKETYLNGTISIVSDDGEQFYTSEIEIRGRGNASWGFDKKPYRIKLKEKTKLLGFPADARNWTLISNFGDKTLMRNLLAFDLSSRLRMPYTPSGRPVNVYLNGEYKGCYQLCDHIDVRKERVDIKEMKVTDTAGTELTGGYFIEIDAYAETEDK